MFLLKSKKKRANILIVCNSLNEDMVEYFENKKIIKEFNIAFAGNLKICSAGMYLTSISKKNAPSLWLCVDLLLGVGCAVRAALRGVRFVIFDTVHISNVPMALTLKVLGIRQIHTIHDLVPHPGRMRFAVAAYNKLISSLADELIVFSSADGLMNDKPCYRLTLAGLTCGTASLGSSGIQLPNHYFLFFGRIEPYKGLRHLVEIANRVSELLPDYVIVVAGRGNDTALTELKGIRNVLVMNWYLESTELSCMIGGATAVLLPYDSATQSGVIVKSYACGTPVIAFEVGDLARYIDNGVTGYCCEHPNLDAFVSAMRASVYSNSSMRRSVMEQYELRFSPSAFVSEYTQVVLENIDR